MFEFLERMTYVNGVYSKAAKKEKDSTMHVGDT
jgi:hypothetical protein